MQKSKLISRNNLPAQLLFTFMTRYFHEIAKVAKFVK